MARVTVEDCLEKVTNHFTLVYLAIERVKQLRKGANPLVQCKNKEIVTALREIAAGKVNYENLDDLGREAEEQGAYKSFQPESLLAETP
ncbi:MAG: DNA-directed RNA polymerase subunit omega [Dissulfurimicrobium sp.]|uniref:DNA-directed RNA polymerase subunit omega n=1 Tax=Dissulfurimicrobium sp. TaxID=2022436 RepID=UPI004049496E